MVEESDTGAQAGPPPVGRTAYRQAMARFATGVTVATTYLDDLDYAMTVTAFASVSLEPPLVLVCVEKRARFHDAVLRSGQWAVSVLPSDATEVSTRLATRGRPLAEQLDGVAYERGVTGSAVLTDALARLECRTWATYDGGDHTIVVGEVVVAEVVESGVMESGVVESGVVESGVVESGVATGSVPSADPMTDPSSGPAKSTPLLHFRGGYGTFADL